MQDCISMSYNLKYGCLDGGVSSLIESEKHYTEKLYQAEQKKPNFQNEIIRVEKKKF